MKIKKNKIVFVTIIVLVVVFIIAYSMYISREKEIPSLNANKIPIPELQNTQEEYSSKLDAINAIKEERQINAPSIYDERLLDSNGVFDANLLDKQKQRLVDSIYKEGEINYLENRYRRNPKVDWQPVPKQIENSKGETNRPLKNNATEAIQKKHQDFFNTPDPKNEQEKRNKDTDSHIPVLVVGDQIVKAYSRLTLRTTKVSRIHGVLVPKNTYLYGFVSFKPNRVLIHITNIHHTDVSLKAMDLQDGNEGIYVKNNFKTDVSKAVLEDVVDQINIPGVPSVDVVKNVFQRSNKNLKVTISNNYKLFLKPIL